MLIVNTMPCELVNYERRLTRKVLMSTGQEKCLLLLSKQYRIRNQKLNRMWILKSQMRNQKRHRILDPDEEYNEYNMVVSIDVIS
jgi:hypothetical protein